MLSGGRFYTGTWHHVRRCTTITKWWWRFVNITFHTWLIRSDSSVSVTTYVLTVTTPLSLPCNLKIWELKKSQILLSWHFEINRKITDSMSPTCIFVVNSSSVAVCGIQLRPVVKKVMNCWSAGRRGSVSNDTQQILLWNKNYQL